MKTGTDSLTSLDGRGAAQLAGACRARFTSYDKLLIVLLGLSILMSFPANLLRLADVGFFQGTFFNLILLLLVIAATANIPLLFAVRLPEWRFPFYFLIFLMYIFCMGSFVPENTPVEGLKYFILPLVAYFAMVGRNFHFYFLHAELFWKFVILTHVVFLGVYYIFLHGTVYPGIGVDSIAHAAFFFFFSGMRILFILAITVIFLEGKRSILLSVVLTIYFVFLMNSKHPRLPFFLLTVGFIAVFVLAGAYYLASIQTVPLIDRFNLLNPFSSSFDLMRGSSGRAGELLSYFDRDSLVTLLVGSGSGFKYVWELGFDGEQNNEIKGYFHMSFANYVAAGGLVGLLMAIYVAKLPFRKYKHPSVENNQIKTIALAMGLYSCIQSNFGFSLGTDMYAWITILTTPFLISMASRSASDKNRVIAP